MLPGAYTSAAVPSSESIEWVGVWFALLQVVVSWSRGPTCMPLAPPFHSKRQQPSIRCLDLQLIHFYHSFSVSPLAIFTGKGGPAGS